MLTIEQAKPILICPVCGENFKLRNTRQRCCSREHGREYSKRLRRPWAYETRECEKCGKEYNPIRRNQRLCKRKCKGNKKTIELLSKRTREFIRALEQNQCGYEYVSGYKNNISQVQLKCQRCGEIITRNASFLRKGTGFADRDCCTAKSRNLAKIIGAIDALRIGRLRAIQGTLIEILKIKKRQTICANCGKVFVKTYRNNCCSLKCANNYSNCMRETRRRIRLHENGDVDHSITLAKLIKRDKAICRICGRKINQWSDSNSDDYPSIDHIVAVANGGTHTWDNVQLAHRGCNTTKRDKVLYIGNDRQLTLAI